jgi:chaperonin GroES
MAVFAGEAGQERVLCPDTLLVDHRFSCRLETKFMDVRPLHDRIIVRRLVEGEQKSGAIIIPDSAKEKPQRGEVIATGSGKVKDDGKRVPLDVKAGDLILFGKYTSQEVKLDGEEYLIMREDEVLAVIDGGVTAAKT